MSRFAATTTAKRLPVSRRKAASASARAEADVSPATDTTRAPSATSDASRLNSGLSVTRRNTLCKTDADSTGLVINRHDER